MRGRLALGGYFFLHGAVGSSWLFTTPMFTSRFSHPDSLGEGIMVGLVVLLGVALAPLGMPLGAWLAGRHSARTVAAGSAVASALVLGGAAFAGSLGVLALAMVALALANGSLFAVLNLLAAGVQRDTGRPVLLWCHGLLALGGLVGSLLAVQLVIAHVRQVDQLLWTAAITLVVAIGLAGMLPDVELEDTRPRMPSSFALLAGAAFAAGVAADQAPGQVSWRLEGPISLSGGNLLALGMAVGALAGGPVVARIGVRSLLYAGAGLTASGLVWLLLLGGPVGLVLAGLGLSCVFPVMLSLAAAGGSIRHAVTAVAAIGYLGTVVGTPLFWLLGSALPLRQPLIYLLVVPVLVAAAGATLNRGSARAPR